MARSPAIELAPNVWRIPTLGPCWINTFAPVDEDRSATLVDADIAAFTHGPEITHRVREKVRGFLTRAR